MLRNQEGSTISIRTSHMDQSLENRIRERAYEIWTAHGYVHGQARSALACGRAGNLGGIDGRARPRTRPAKEATVACTFEDHEDPRSGQLTPHITRGNTSAQTPSARRVI